MGYTDDGRDKNMVKIIKYLFDYFIVDDILPEDYSYETGEPAYILIKITLRDEHLLYIKVDRYNTRIKFGRWDNMSIETKIDSNNHLEIFNYIKDLWRDNGIRNKV